MTKRLKCRYCKRGLLHPHDDRQRTHDLSATRDHVIPKSIGGTLTAWCCRQCNQIKADMPLMAWAKFMQTNPEWWVRFRGRGHMLREVKRLDEIRVYRSTFPFCVPAPQFCRGLV